MVTFMRQFHRRIEEIELGIDPDGWTQSPPSSQDMDRTLLWEMLSRVELDRKHLATNRIVTFERTDKAHFMFDVLRTNVLRILRTNNWTSIAVTSPTPGCGKTVVSLNLAFSLSHLHECHTAVLDLDLRRHQVVDTLGFNGSFSIEKFLNGQAPVEDTFLRPRSNLAVAPNSQSVRDAAELLQSSGVTTVLTDLKNRLEPDVLIYDLPPMLANDDVLAFLPNVDCVLLVAAAETSTTNEVDLCESILSNHTNVLGVVLNKCRFDPERYGY
jgi:protein-tyrosine kinase